MAQNNFNDWLTNALKTSNFEPLKGNFENEVDWARRIFNFKPASCVVEEYLRQLEPIFECNADESDRLRRKGNELYKNNDQLEKAAIFYTKAIYKAPIDSPCLARAHANRAAVLYKLQYYEAAYEDCICAIKFNHPSADALLPRQALIAWKLKDQEKMQNSIECFHNFNIDIPASIQRLQQRLQNEKNSIQKFEDLKSSKLPKLNKIKLTKSNRLGRYLIASENIEPGELIIEERAAAFLLDESGKFQTQFLTTDRTNLVAKCDNCAEDDIVPFPCYACRAVFYCSNKCRQDHFPIHQFECPGYQMSLFKDYFREQMSLRCLVSSFEKTLRNLTNDANVRTAEDLWPILMKTRKDGDLLGMFSSFKHFPGYYVPVRTSLNLFLMYYYLSRHTNFFARTQLERQKIMLRNVEWDVLVLALLMYFYSAKHFNVSSVIMSCVTIPFSAKLYHTRGLNSMVLMKTMAAALYPWFSFVSHSCHMNVYVQQDGSKLSVISSRRIEKGEAVTLDYMGDSSNMTTDARRQKLKSTWCFNCNCDRCSKKEDHLFINSNGVPCACGGNYILSTQKILPCNQCGQSCNETLYRSLMILDNQLDYTPETYIQFYVLFSKLRKLLKNQSLQYLSSYAGIILDNYLLKTKSEAFTNEEIYNSMVQLAIELLEIAEKLYNPGDVIGRYLALALDVLSIKNNSTCLKLVSENKKLIERELFFISGKARKMFDERYKSILGESK